MSSYIRLSDVLSEMDRLDDQGKPIKFNIKFVTANRKERTGGEIIEIKGGRKCVDVKEDKPVFDTRKSVSEPKLHKNPNHWVNSTRNILLPNGRIRKVHIRLIIEFNDQKVCF